MRERRKAVRVRILSYTLCPDPVKTASGARAVQIVHGAQRGARRIEHLGSRTTSWSCWKRSKPQRASVLPCERLGRVDLKGCRRERPQPSGSRSGEELFVNPMSQAPVFVGRRISPTDQEEG